MTTTRRRPHRDAREAPELLREAADPAPRTDLANRYGVHTERAFGVPMAFEPASSSKGFGSCVARFGVGWMVDTLGEPGG